MDDTRTRFLRKCHDYVSLTSNVSRIYRRLLSCIGILKIIVNHEPRRIILHGIVSFTGSVSKYRRLLWCFGLIVRYYRGSFLFHSMINWLELYGYYFCSWCTDRRASAKSNIQNATKRYFILYIYASKLWNFRRIFWNPFLYLSINNLCDWFLNWINFRLLDFYLKD